MVIRLHPRSAFTTSLFSTTFLVAFFVVAAPHVIPCPSHKSNALIADDGSSSTSASPQGKRRKRHCPVPRPAVGLVKELCPAAAATERTRVKMDVETVVAPRISAAAMTDRGDDGNVKVVFLERYSDIRRKGRGDT